MQLHKSSGLQYFIKKKIYTLCAEVTSVFLGFEIINKSATDQQKCGQSVPRKLISST